MQKESKSKKEVWRPIPGFEGIYSASNLGNIKSHARTVKASNRSLKIGERILNKTVLRSGTSTAAETVTLGTPQKGRRSYSVAGLVLEAFTGKHEGMVAFHIDGDGLNNCRSNLKWVKKGKWF